LHQQASAIGTPNWSVKSKQTQEGMAMNDGFTAAQRKFSDHSDTGQLAGAYGTNAGSETHSDLATPSAGDRGSTVARQFMRMTEAHDQIRLRLLAARTR
jgi:hypothetical protein